MGEPSSASIESLLAQIETVEAGTLSFNMFVPQSLTWNEQPIDQGAAMAVLLDKLLAKDMYPDGFDEQSTGRLYRYKSE